MGWAELLTDTAAAYRLTRLVTADTLTQPLRDRIVEAAYVGKGRRSEAVGKMPQRGLDHRDPGAWSEYAMNNDPAPPKIATLVTCRWCAGVWVAAGVTVARWVAPRAWNHAARGLTVAAGAALVAGLERD